ncbi:hypothetical protein [Pseudomonas xionganensis]|uniref:Uncharacterized protein n=1 Tax=Pseudomonas xionganensis TaxID=2654845 RepID=A0A6I4KV42_9PSED|nr:hypothetical protein [Pseudomonas xionganensis]MVW76560.1 hypothetical protein [Pseudomonas xionganensis]
MTPHPTFSTGSLNRLAERTEYELWLLEAVYEVVEQKLFPSWPDSVVYPLEKSKPDFFSYGQINAVIGDWRPHFLNVGAPLIFVSSFKLLDMFIEWVLEENGIVSTFRFDQKRKKLDGSSVFPQEIEARPWLKERLIALYSALIPLRGTIIHNKNFISADGAIRVARSKTGVVESMVDISSSQLRTLVVSILSVLKYVDGTWHLNESREKILRHALDELAPLHGLPLLGQKQPFHTRVRVYLEGDDPFDFDPIAIQRDLAERYVNQDCSFDLRVLMVRDGEVVEAYLFPDTLVATADTDWPQGVDAQQYKTKVPDDINPEHLCLG